MCADTGSVSHSGFKVFIQPADEGLYVELKLRSVVQSITVPMETGVKQFRAAYFQQEKWTHVAVVYDFDGKAASVYLNGTLIDSQR